MTFALGAKYLHEINSTFAHILWISASARGIPLSNVFSHWLHESGVAKYLKDESGVARYLEERQSGCLRRTSQRVLESFRGRDKCPVTSLMLDNDCHCHHHHHHRHRHHRHRQQNLLWHLEKGGRNSFERKGRGGALVWRMLHFRCWVLGVVWIGWGLAWGAFE